MKILRVSSDLYPAFVGGIAIHVHEMSKAQADCGNDVTVFTSVWGDETRKEIRDNYHIVRFKGITIFRNSITLMLLYNLLKQKSQYDVIHAHSHLYFSSLLCAIARMVGPPPLVITNHGLFSQTVPMWIQNIYVPTIGKWTYKKADKIICYTETERSQLITLGMDSDHIRVIHNGIDTSLFTLNPDVFKKKQILWVGKYVPGKGVEYLLAGFKLFSINNPDYLLIMVGTGPLKKDFLSIIQDMDLEEKIILKDFVPNTDLPRLYQESVLFILPSIEEGVPRTILEAMACGVPVVCTDLPQLIDIVNECGITVPKRDPKAIAEAISIILSDKDLSIKLGENGRKNVVDNYSWEDTVTRTISLYEELICQK